MMRKLLFLCLLLLPATPRLLAQAGIHLGFFGSFQNTWIMNRDDNSVSKNTFSYKTTWGYSGMGKLGINFADPIGIHIGANYSIQGQKSTSIDSITQNIINNYRKLTYLKIPLLLHINSEPGPAMFTFEFGPQLGIIMDGSYISSATTTPTDITAAFKPNDISGTWSIGAEFALTDWLHFVLQHRGDYSFFDIENKAFTLGGLPFYNNGRAPARNATFAIMGGFNFCFLPKTSSRNAGRLWIR